MLPILVLSWQAALQTISPAIHFDCSPICHTNLRTQGICFLLISCLGTEGLVLTLCLFKQWVFHSVHGSTGWCLKMWDLMSVILCLHWRPCCGNADLPCWEHCFYACCHFNTRVLTCLCFRSLFILQKGRILKPWWSLWVWNTALLGVKKEAGSRGWSTDRASSLGSLFSLVQ